ncbi:MAG: hypothetical protein IJ133_06175 [Clostridia bacterium]|nr:hypothetical protein [Clostridia bacterium]
MRRFFKTAWFKILMILLAVLVVFVVLAAVLGVRSSPATAVAGAASQPFSYVGSVLGRGFQQIGHFFVRSSTYEKEIQELQDQVTGYQKELADYQETKEKLSNYEAFDDLSKEHPDYKVCSATIIGKDAANNYCTFVVDRGEASGVKVNDPVICGRGQLVGVVTKVAPTYCVVSTILDPNINTSAQEIRTRENGYVTNTPDLARKGFCRLSGLDRGTQVSKGGVVVTAGIGGIYPRDLVIGTVQSVQDDKHDISSYAVIKPNVKIEEIGQVLILLSFEGQGISVSADLSDAQSGDGKSPEIGKTQKTEAARSTAGTTTRAAVTTTTRPVTRITGQTANTVSVAVGQ